MSDRRRSDRDERDVRRSDRDDYRDRSDRDRDRDRDDYRSGRSDRDRSDRDRDRYASDVRDRDRSKRSRERDDGARGSRRDDERDAKRRRDDDVTDRGRGASSSSSSYADAQHARAMGVTSSGADDDGMEVVQPTEEELEEARRVEALLQNSSGAHHREAKIAGIRPTEKLSARPEPVSIEELAKQRAQESAKPKFLTKEERQRLALERRAAQVKEKQEKTAEIRESRQQFFHQADDAPPAKPDLIDDRRGGGRDRERDRDRDRDRSDRDRDRDRERERDHWRDRRNDDLEKNRVGGGGSSSSDRGRERDYRDDRGGRGRDEAGDRQDRDRDRRREELEKKENLTREESQELSEIKAHYLGLKKEKRKVVKPSEKFKFVFAWDLSEDTSRDHNPLYNQRLDVRPSFGRGFLAGIDQKQQLKAFEADKDHSRVARVERRLDESYLGRGDTGRHWSQKALAEMTQRDWRIFKEDHSISTKGGRVPVPMRNWGESKLPTVLLDAIESAGYKQPMPIQMQSIPIGLQGRDLIGLAETGSGKTCAFVLPMLVYISKLPPMTAENAADGPYALIMAPTRELALQIEQEAAKFAGAMGFRTVAVVGGQSIEEQGFALRRGAEILIATPGRLVDCLEQRYVVLNQCNYVVLDEADRMVDMGFEVQVTTILDAMPSSNLKSEDETTAEEQMAALQEEKPDHVYRTTVMFSATMPVAVERLARKYLRHPAVIQIGEVGKAGEKIEQRVEFVKGDNDKKNKLLNLLYSGIAPPIMVFVNQKKNCDIISRAINKAGFRSATLHSGKSQELREEAMDGFKAGTIDILVSTDVAGRGIDVKGVTHVINYDMAKSIADYTHRIGRTGRAGMKGVAISFITNDDADLFYDLKQMLQASGNPVPNELAHHPAAKIKPGAAGTQGKTRRETVIYAP